MLLGANEIFREDASEHVSRVSFNGEIEFKDVNYHNPGMAGTEHEVMKSIKHLSRTITVVIVEHRLTTLSDCDIIYKLSKGKIVD